MQSPLIEWRDEFSVGIPGVDHEHQELVGIINELYAHLSDEGAEDEVIEFLGEIYAKISAHFALEEREMRERGYDQYDEHKDDHEKLLDDLRDMMDAYEDNGQFSGQQLSAAMTAWFVEHFKTQDARLHKFLD